jgi:hypothetical protein
MAPIALSCEDMWYTLSCERVCDVKRVQDGVSQIVAALLKFVFKGPTTHAPSVYIWVRSLCT